MLYHRFYVSLEQTQRYECATRLVFDCSHEHTLTFPNVSRRANSFAATSDRMPWLRLPDQFQRELNLAGGRLCGIDESRALDGQLVPIENRQVAVGEEKFARLKILKISARNWALKFSEIRPIPAVQKPRFALDRFLWPECPRRVDRG